LRKGGWGKIRKKKEALVGEFKVGGVGWGALGCGGLMNWGNHEEAGKSNLKLKKKGWVQMKGWTCQWTVGPHLKRKNGGGKRKAPGKSSKGWCKEKRNGSL